MMKLKDMTSITDAKTNLSRYVKEVAEEERDITILSHNKPQAVLTSASRYEALMEELENLRNELFYARLAARVQAGPQQLHSADEVIYPEQNSFDDLTDEELFD